MEEMDEEQSSGKQLVHTVGNHIYFYTDVTDESALQAVKAIKNLNNIIKTSKIYTNIDSEYEDDEDCDEKINRDSPIYFHINSNGGGFFSGMAIVDTIRKSKTPIYTIGEGAIASMASIIFLAGKKRYINQNAYILIHEVRTFVSGTFSNLTDEFENSKMIMNNIINFYKNNSKISNIQLHKFLKKDIWFDSNTSLKYGFADKIV